MSGNQRGYAWVDEEVEHSAQDEARASVLASKWSDLHNEEESRQFARQADIEDGRDYGPDPDECSTCDGSGYIIGGDTGCGAPDCPAQLVALRCPSPSCEDGFDMGSIREQEKRQLELEAERRLEVELVEDKLERIGARMMRPYEHWNEEEALMEYLERER